MLIATKESMGGDITHIKPGRIGDQTTRSLRRS